MISKLYLQQYINSSVIITGIYPHMNVYVINVYIYIYISA